MTKKPDKEVDYEEPVKENPKMNFHEMLTGLKDMLPEDTIRTLLSTCKPKEPQAELCELHLVGSEDMILKILGK